MMKKVCLLVIMVAVALMGHAQSLRNNLLKGYKPGISWKGSLYERSGYTAFQYLVWCVQCESGGSGRGTCYR